MNLRVFLLLFLMIAATGCTGLITGSVSGTPLPDADPDHADADACLPAASGTHQLRDAAHGVCFLYPERFDVFQAEDGGVTLYVRSLLNTEAPLASLSFALAGGRSLDDVTAQRLADFALPEGGIESVTVDGVPAAVLDTLPGQDINRRLIVVRDDVVYDLMVARIGPEYGSVGLEAETLYGTIVDSLRFIEVDPAAELAAGPECPPAASGTTLYTNEEDGFCVLLPDGYAVDDSLTTESGGGETAVYVDSLLDTSHARLFINVDAADGRTLDQITTEKAAEIESIMGEPAQWSFGWMLDGVPANQFDQVPGQDLSRQVVLVHRDRLYTLTFIPDDPQAEAYGELELLYETVLDSFSFLRR